MNTNKFNPLIWAQKFALLIFCCIGVYTVCSAQTGQTEKHRSYYADNTLKEKGKYQAGTKEGYWYYYAPNSAIERKEKWKNGILQWQIYYTPKGKISKTVDKNGTVKTRPACGC